MNKHCELFVKIDTGTQYLGQMWIEGVRTAGTRITFEGRRYEVTKILRRRQFGPDSVLVELI